MKGFTLIEALIYLGVLALFIASAASLGFAFMDEEALAAAALDQEEEGRFLMDKVGWALGQAASAPPDGTTTALILRTADPRLDPVVIRYDTAARQVVMGEGSADVVPITAGDVDAFSFTAESRVIEARASIASSTFTLSRLLP
jgi:hypothetical protein